MHALKTVLRRGFDRVERGLDAAFGPAWNPLVHLGALGWFMFWIVTATGVYLFFFYDTGIEAAYGSVRWISEDQWFHAGIMRSFHRYASDLLVVVMMLHLVREFALDRLRGARWFSWFTGLPLIWFVYIAGITGYWMLWDELAQYVATVTAELLDWLPIFGEPIVRNFVSESNLSDRFFTLVIFIHVAVPLLMLVVMWVHIQRISRPRINPPRELMYLTLGALLIVSLALPANLQGPADLSRVPVVVDLDWFYLPLYPLTDIVPLGAIWGGLALFFLLLAGLPWLPPAKRRAAAAVFLDHCDGCARCVEDCPYAAVELVPRSDGKPFPHEVAVNPARCVACGICMGACPSSTPFRRTADLVTGIDLPDYPLTLLRERVQETAAGLEGPGRVLVLACEHGAGGVAPPPGTVTLRCVAMAPPSLIDFIISRGLADGVAVAGCAERECHHRLGVEWTKQRFAGERDPYLRARVPRERVATIWAGPTETARLARELAAFRAHLAALPPDVPRVRRARPSTAPTDATAVEEAGT